jgi:hypothetical protein
MRKKRISRFAVVMRIETPKRMVIIKKDRVVDKKDKLKYTAVSIDK